MFSDASPEYRSLNLVYSDSGNAAATRPAMDDRRWRMASFADLIAYIVDQHHAYTRRELSRMAVLAAEVQLRHGHMYPELHQIRELIDTMNRDINAHMVQEEEMLFPRLEALEKATESGTPAPPSFFGSLLNPVRHMMGDHGNTAQMLKHLRMLTRDYTAPDDTCMTHRELYQGLSNLEKDLHQHMHLEETILFPRALAFENADNR